MQDDLARTAVKPRPGRTAPRATKRSGTGYRTLRPDEPATTRVTHTVKLRLFSEEQRPQGKGGATLLPLNIADDQSRTLEHFTEAS